MPQQPREFEIGGVYHIVNRGVEKRKIFLKNQDYSRFILALEFLNEKENFNLWNLIARAERARSDLTTLKERLDNQRRKAQRPVVELLAFTLMPNHFHLIIREIMKEGIPLFMQKLCSGYVTYFNKQCNRVGPLFQSRYKSVRIKEDIQLATVFTYVHTNPAELIESGWKDFHVKNPKATMRYLENYKWSSYQDYIGNSTFPTVTNREFFLNFYGSEEKCRQAVKDWISYKAAKTELDSNIFE